MDPTPRKPGLATRVVMGLIRVYQRTVSRFVPPTCRYYPSCSEYARQAFQRYGLWVGGWKALRRLFRCHPWHPGGYDPLD